MKRCPQCNRVEPDNTLAFCRFDGSALVNQSGSISEDTGTVRFDSASVATETPTSVLPQQLTNPGVAAPTTVLPSQPVTTNTREPRTTNPRPFIAVLGFLVVVGLVAGVYFWSRSKNTTAIQSIAVMPFVNASGNSELDYLSDGMT